MEELPRKRISEQTKALRIIMRKKEINVKLLSREMKKDYLATFQLINELNKRGLVEKELIYYDNPFPDFPNLIHRKVLIKMTKNPGRLLRAKEIMKENFGENV